ncbi:MAG: phosphoribosylformylglycinamidine synthase I [Candidatus Omnitrophica bacterium]|nr:phosphoribosylformylglycinamidine synthase I [Candidatus Omnitrophota bacterium]
MSKAKALVIRTAGTNCDVETAHAFRLAGAFADVMHINSLIKNKSAMKKFNILAIPGGFSYGDDIASGKILANEMKHSLKNELSEFVSRGKLVIGICNGFQVLVKMGLLPLFTKDELFAPKVTLTLNDAGHYIDRWIYLKKDPVKNLCVWTKQLPEIIYLPIAHAEGKFVPQSSEVLKKLRANGQIVFRYSDEAGNEGAYPVNPNGSVDNIAGICDSTGRILGMMPHPERHIFFTQHPRWQRCVKKGKETGIGLQIFRNAVQFVNKA